MRRLRAPVLACSCILAVGCAGKGDAEIAPMNEPIGTSAAKEAPAGYGDGAYPAGDADAADYPASAPMEEAEMAPEATSTAGNAYGRRQGRGARKRDRNRYDEDALAKDSRAEKRRPGLGTEYGEQRHSASREVGFRRSNPNHPDRIFTLWYDDAAGVRAASGTHDHRSSRTRAEMSDAGLTVVLRDDYGRALPGAYVDGRTYAIGEKNARYSILIENDTGARYEAVASVDGLDVIDGRTASFDKRGYVIDPYTSVEIDGWRTSESSVAAFRFAAVPDSYAGRKGESRNVGVVGVAFFGEDGPGDRYWDVRRRENANPFPGN